MSKLSVSDWIRSCVKSRNDYDDNIGPQIVENLANAQTYLTKAII